MNLANFKEPITGVEGSLAAFWFLELLILVLFNNYLFSVGIIELLRVEVVL